MEAREKILTVHLEGESLARDVDISELAKKTELYSGSDLKNMVN
jgi:ATP-dependent Zn protease